MDSVRIPIDGKETMIRLAEVSVDQLRLDELNPRISFFRDNQPGDELTEEQIVFALTNKKPEAYRKLRDSIHNNRGIISPIWIEPRTTKGDRKYTVIEGNTRVVIYQYLRNEEPNEERWKKILCYVLPSEISDEQKNFIRLQSHLRGTTEWDAYEKAKYLYKLWEEDGWSVSRLEKQTKMSAKQISENIEAYKKMEEQYLPTHGDDPNEVSKFSYFVEYVKDKELQKLMARSSKTIDDFCNWVADKEKIPTGQDVRRLRDIFESDDTVDAFVRKGFDAAIQLLQLKKPHLVSSLYRDIENVVEGLKNVSAFEIDEIVNEGSSEKEKMIKELARWSHKVLNMILEGKDGE
ncbi:MAG: hypothetical protein ACTSUO_02345 [Candidatus Thorarchaeota archaeon]